MVQRFGPFSFVVNTDKISVEMAEDQGWKLFLDSAMKNRYGILTYDNWNIMHMCLTGDQDPFKEMDDAGLDKFTETANAIFDGAKLLTDDLVAMNTALINEEIDAYFTGGTYTRPARPGLNGATNIRGHHAELRPAGRRQGRSGLGRTDVGRQTIRIPRSSPRTSWNTSRVRKCRKAVSFSEGTYNPVAQMGNPEVFNTYDSDELDAIQWDSLPEEMARSAEYSIVASYDKLNELYNAAKRG